MFDHIENLKIISSIHKCSNPYSIIPCRSYHTFFFRISGSIQYNFSDKRLLAKGGDIVFIPKDSSYTVQTLCESASYTSIAFDGDFLVKPEPVCYRADGLPDFELIANHFSDMWNLGTQADKYKCISLLYSLLSYLSAAENADYSKTKKFKIIEPAVKYLKEHIYDSTCKADRLHRLCGISGTYFRQIFVAKFGMTPQSYIISKRLSHAKSIITGGDYRTIAEVAQSVGFNDPLYFSKVFKKTYGVSPSEINTPHP